jgi:hypothetical protein
MKIVVALALASGLFWLVKRKLIHIDLSFLFFGALLLLSVASISDSFIDALAWAFDIVYAPLAVVLFTIFILLCMITLLLVYVTRLGQRHVELLRRLALLEMALAKGREPGHEP